MPAKQKITPCLWFSGNAEEAMEFYFSIFKDGKILEKTYWKRGANAPELSVLTARFQIGGQEYIALNGGPEFNFNEAISLTIDCGSQEEIDDFTEKLIADGGEQGPCGWVKDKFGLSWQIVPSIIPEMLQDKDQGRVERVMDAVMQMRKLDVAKLEAAYRG
ncbi:VOC family protein [Phyllobacterium sp. SB3]|uniref:VOC family protein n=1 Tax=Phyllobacterium sp. SB3 TaxID=3156073 RepID=UPI0032AEBB8E